MRSVILPELPGCDRPERRPEEESTKPAADLPPRISVAIMMVVSESKGAISVRLVVALSNIAELQWGGREEGSISQY
jgi:hypothetical protein